MIRELSANDDLSFVYSTWTKQISESYLPFSHKTSKYLYVKACRRAAEQAILKGVKINAACDPKDPNILYGYLVYEDKLAHEQDSIIEGLSIKRRKVIHFLYVKGAFRGMGLAKQLIESARINPDQCVFTCWTNTTDKLLEKYPRALYVPLGLFDR